VANQPNKEMAASNRMSRDSGRLETTIANGATVSAAIPTGGAAWGSYQIPAAFTGVLMTIEVNNDPSRALGWTTVRDETGTAVAAVTVAVNNTCPLPNNTFKSEFYRLVSGSSEGAARTVTIYHRG